MARGAEERDSSQGISVTELDGDDLEPNPALSDAIEQVATAPDDHSHAASNESFNTYCAVAHYVMSGVLPGKISVMIEMPFGIAQSVVVISTVQALELGTKIYAALTRDPGEQTHRGTIGFTELWDAHMDVATDGSDLALAWAAARQQVDQLDDVLSVAAINLVSEVTELAPALASQEDVVGNIILEHLHRGAAVEFCLTRLLAEEMEASSVFGKIVAVVTGSEDLTDPVNVAAFESAVGLPDTIFPWPMDERCLCGKGLKPVIYCCDPSKPIDMGAYAERLLPDFVLERACCGQEFHGFRCDACGRVYSWTKAVVETLCIGWLM